MSLSAQCTHFFFFSPHLSFWRANNVGCRCAFLPTIKMEHGAGGRRVPTHPRKSGCPSDGEDESQKPFCATDGWSALPTSPLRGLGAVTAPHHCSHLRARHVVLCCVCAHWHVLAFWGWGRGVGSCVCVSVCRVGGWGEVGWGLMLWCAAGRCDDLYNVWLHEPVTESFNANCAHPHWGVFRYPPVSPTEAHSYVGINLVV